ncbi:MAG: glycine cleavage system protein GcvH [Lentisphaeria bacterium]|jgi:glycine cleavage system H protein
MKRYSKEHEWVELEGDVATMGITAFAAEELGDITYVELPALGKQVKTNEVLCVVESVKAASDVYCPVGGTVAAVNQELDGEPGLVNQEPEGKGWFCKLKGASPADFNALMTAEDYAKFTAK